MKDGILMSIRGSWGAGINIWLDRILYAFVYFILLNNPKLTVWKRIEKLSTILLVEFLNPEYDAYAHEWGQKSQGKILDQEFYAKVQKRTEKLARLMLWHTEIVSHLIQPNLLDHIENQEQLRLTNAEPNVVRVSNPIARLILSLANEDWLSRTLRKDVPFQWAKAYLDNYWSRDYTHEYPGPRNSNRSIWNEWTSLSRRICDFSTRVKHGHIAYGDFGLPIITENHYTMIVDWNEELHVQIKIDWEKLKAAMNTAGFRRTKEKNVTWRILGAWMGRTILGVGIPELPDNFCATALFAYLDPAYPLSENHVRILREAEKSNEAKAKNKKKSLTTRKGSNKAKAKNKKKSLTTREEPNDERLEEQR
ncbi:hypothetical protein CROQUDRAFT_717089 [Cronartium quercuum f. sp. fusiforme G11]|uniref:Uncharacterized protein n=1 Tax=Cronartium quercuum f. sp. fusiforme G11 TaxID=708437 RepID=A0A9P6NDH3_9BASI|nr:hypothetical protein CROQUDRAFT_717089 [Cronartium quercuum f. sp. fusiforme G11]